MHRTMPENDGDGDSPEYDDRDIIRITPEMINAVKEATDDHHRVIADSLEGEWHSSGEHKFPVFRLNIVKDDASFLRLQFDPPNGVSTLEEAWTDVLDRQIPNLLHMYFSDEMPQEADDLTDGIEETRGSFGDGLSDSERDWFN